MDVLISWSGKQSRAVAEALYEWLPKVIPSIKPWISTQDIDKGSRWLNELQKYLRTAKGCIVCLTPENIDSKWVHWETGAIALAQENPICPVLLNISPDKLRDGPLGQFQAAKITKPDMLHLVISLNQRLDTSENVDTLRGRLDANWEALQRGLTEISKLGIPLEVLDIVQAVDDVRAKFQRRWATDKAAESWDPIKHLVNDCAADVERLRTQTGVETRLKLHLYELKGKIGSITTPNSREEAHRRGDDIFVQFEKTIRAIRADYDAD